MSDLSPLQQQADQIRASGALGKPGALTRLFDYLLERSLAGEAPKELEIAFKVFAKDSRFDVSQDSVVRVYMHKLRRRLDDYYSDLASPPPVRLTIPKGEYRLTLESQPGPSVEVAPTLPTRARPQGWMTAAAVLIAAMLGALVTWLTMKPPVTEARMEAVRTNPIWAPLLADDLPITIVLGDYYLMGEVDQSGLVGRLVREFNINSRADFVQQVEAHPQMMERYRNLNLTYLPTSIAYAMRDVVPMLSEGKRVRIMMMSDLDGRMLANSHIVYIGFFSGLGILSDPTFAASRLVVGSTFDDLIDDKTQATYRSTAGDATDSSYVDYGFVSTFPGPGRNRVVIIAGTRDTGVMHAADSITTPAALIELGVKAGQATSFESLFEVYGVARSGMSGKLLFASPLDTRHIWEMER